MFGNSDYATEWLGTPDEAVGLPKTDPAALAKALADITRQFASPVPPHLDLTMPFTVPQSQAPAAQPPAASPALSPKHQDRLPSPQPPSQPLAASRGWDFDRLEHAFHAVESGGELSASAKRKSPVNPWQAIGPVTRSGDRAYGRFQVMGANIPSWTQRHYGRSLTPQEFLANPEAQRAVFRGEMGRYLDQHDGSLNEAASMWFSGRPAAQGRIRNDGYIGQPEYIRRIRRAFFADGYRQPTELADSEPTRASFIGEVGAPTHDQRLNNAPLEFRSGPTTQAVTAPQQRRFYRVNADGSETAVEGNPFEQPARWQDDPMVDAGQFRQEPSTQHNQFAAQEAPKEMGLGGQLWDLIRSGATGVRSGVEGMAGLPAATYQGAKWLGDQAGVDVDKLDLGPAGNALRAAPSTQDWNKATSAVIGPSYSPKTTAGEYAKTTGEFAAGLPLGGNLRNVGRMVLGDVLAPALASETAGQMTEGTGLEPAARLLAGLVGGVGGNLAIGHKGVPPARTFSQRERDAVDEASRRMGVPLPSFMMPDASSQRIAARRLADTPLVGQPVLSAAETARDRLGERTHDLANAMGNQDYPGAVARTYHALRGYQTRTIRDLSSAVYDNVDNVIDQAVKSGTHQAGILTPLQDTRIAIRELRGMMDESASDFAQSAIDRVIHAAQRPGLTYDGLKRLRTTVGEAMDDKLLPAQSRMPLDTLYKALTRDLERAVQRSGGPRALQAWQGANTYARDLREVDDEVSRIIGKSGEQQPDTIAKSVRVLLSSTDRSPRNRLSQLREAMDATDPDSWDDLGAAVLADMGTSSKTPGQFSPQQFVKGYAKTSQRGRELLWPDPHVRRAIDDIATLSRRWVDGNPGRGPGGLGYMAGVGGLASGMAYHPLGTLVSLAGINGLAHLISRPATARKISAWARTRQAGRSVGPNLIRDLADRIAEENGGDPDAIAKQLSSDDIEAKLEAE